MIATKIAVEFERQIVWHGTTKVTIPPEILAQAGMKVGDMALIGLMVIDDEKYVTIRKKPQP